MAASDSFGFRRVFEGVARRRFRKSVRENTDLLTRRVDAEQKYEGLDYGPIDNELQQSYERSLTRRDLVSKWLQTIVVLTLIGALTGFFIFFLFLGSRRVIRYKLELLEHLLSGCGGSPGGTCFWYPFLTFVGISTGLTACSSFLVAYFLPFAASGLPELQAFLNGIKMPSIFRVSSFFVKCLALLLAEWAHIVGDIAGPSLQLGGSIGATLSQGKLSLFERLAPYGLKTFRTDNEKRNFVSAGVSAGFASIFGSPIGGMLYSVEQGSSFWTGPLSAMVFFSCCTALAVYNFLNNGFVFERWGHWSRTGLFDFGHSVGVAEFPFKIYHFPFYILLGIIGGLVGAFFNTLNLGLMWFRVNKLRRPSLKMLEGCIVGLVTSIVIFVVPYLYNSCQPISYEAVEEFNELHIRYTSVFCKQGEYSQLGTLFFENEIDALRAMTAEVVDWDVGPLLIIAAVYTLLACWSFGAALPTGLFIPCFVIGGALGRALGMGLDHGMPWLDININTYTILGAAAVTGGVTRLTISLTVLLVEATDYAYFALPVMLVVLIARWVAGLFVGGIFTNYNRVLKAPILDWQPPHDMYTLKAKDVMNKPPVCFFLTERVGDVFQTLGEVTHNGFPIVNSKGQLVGTILRSQISVLLHHRAFYSGDELGREVSPSSILPRSAFVNAYPKFYNITKMELTHREEDMYLYFKPYMNLNPVKVIETCPLTRAYRAFRTLGLRHIVVVDFWNVVQGVITRKDLSKLSTLHQWKKEWVYLAAHGDHLTEAEILHLRRATAYATRGESFSEAELTDADRTGDGDDSDSDVSVDEHTRMVKH